MEWLATLFAVLLIVIVVGAAFSFAGARGPWGSAIWFIAILFLATLAIGVWADPVGPVAFGVPWLGFLVTAIFIGLLIAAATPGSGDRHRRRHIKEMPLQRDSNYEPDTEPAPINPRTSEEAGVGAATAVSVFFWVFAILAISIVLVRFFAAV